MLDGLTLMEILTPLGLVLGGLAVGFLLEKLVITWLGRVARRTAWRGDDALISASSGIIRVWGMLVGATAALFALALDPGMHNLLLRVIGAVAILSFVVFAARLAGEIVAVFTQGERARLPAASLLTNVTRALVVVVGLLVLFQTVFGINMGPLLAALGVGGIAVALALQDTLSNLFAGIYIIFTHSMRPGDYVKLDGGQEGHIADISWRNTTIRTREDTLVIVPNAKLASAIVTSFGQPGPPLEVTVPVGVSYDSDLQQVEAVTMDVATEVMQTVPGGIAEFEPIIRYNAFADLRVTFNVTMRVVTFADRALVTHEFLKRLHKRCQAEGITLSAVEHDFDQPRGTNDGR